MFTGIVQALVPVASLTLDANVMRLGLPLGALCDQLENGASVAVNGTCLTVTATSNGTAFFDVIEETRRLTNLGDLQAGNLVNVERSFRAGDEIGGHLVSGHVACTAEVTAIEAREGVRNLTFRAPDPVMKFLVHKGFAALDGASLTLAFVNHAEASFGVCLIPETIERTTLGRVVPGSRVNLEPDSQTQTIVQTLERMLDSPELLARLAR
ncbi:MAG: riboflavin synthase subunit alpha [Pseudomonadales bacterium]|nr:riboflavin synthase subunit alpha [Pseudomonadales bacterium]MCP5184906.1 riboflavin synthase subunit alpha [Pseudomonadales bacterium]